MKELMEADRLARQVLPKLKALEEHLKGGDHAKEGWCELCRDHFDAVSDLLMGVARLVGPQFKSLKRFANNFARWEGFFYRGEWTAQELIKEIQTWSKSFGATHPSMPWVRLAKLAKRLVESNGDTITLYSRIIPTVRDEGYRKLYKWSAFKGRIPNGQRILVFQVPMWLYRLSLQATPSDVRSFSVFIAEEDWHHVKMVGKKRHPEEREFPGLGWSKRPQMDAPMKEFLKEVQRFRLLDKKRTLRGREIHEWREHFKTLRERVLNHNHLKTPSHYVDRVADPLAQFWKTWGLTTLAEDTGHERPTEGEGPTSA